MRYDDEPVNFEEAARLQNLDEQIEARLRGQMQARAREPQARTSRSTRPSRGKHPPSQARSGGQDALDPELLRDLHDFYQPRAQTFQRGLDRVWNRLEQRGIAPTQQSRSRPGASPGLPHERIYPMQHMSSSGPRWLSRFGALVAAVVLVVLVSGLALGLILVRHNNSSPASGPQNQGTGPATTPFSVSSVDLAVTPASIAGVPCGTSISFTYTATFHIPAGTAGGTIQFEYTLNNGRSSTNASVTVSPGQTNKTYTFTSSGTLPPDHTYPGIAEVLVNSPNMVHSPQVQPGGACVAAAFHVTSVSMAVNPASIAGLACGTQITVTYTATFHIAAGGPGGTIHFEYTVNNGRGSTSASITVAPGQTTATYHFTWSGKLPADHTYPAQGGVIVDSPNQAQSPLVAPTGACH